MQKSLVQNPDRITPAAPTRRRIGVTAAFAATAAAAALLSAPSAARAADWYVSPSGRDTGSGAVGSPFRSIQKAADVANPGDTVYLRGGTHSYSPSDNAANGSYDYALAWITRSGASGAPITFTNYPGEKPVIASAGVRGCTLMVGGQWVNFRGLTFEGSQDYITLARAQALAQKAYQHFVATGEDKIPSTPDDPVSATEARSMNQFGILLLNVTRNNVTYTPAHNRIENCTFYKHSACPIGVQTDYVTIQGCQIYNNLKRNNRGTSAVNLFSLKPADGSTATKIIVQNNRIWDNENLCVYYRNGKITDGNGIIVDVSGNDSGSSGYVGRVRIQSNLLYANGGAGVCITRSNNVDVYNNTCFFNVRSPYLKSGGTIGGVSGLAPWGEIMEATTQGCSVRNNILYGRSDASILYQASANTVWAYNLFYVDGKADDDTTIPVRGTNYVRRDPRFVAPSLDSAADFRLQANSPAIDAGTNIGLYTDFTWASRPVGAGFDIGAFEWRP